jgi:hypothetical protein
MLSVGVDLQGMRETACNSLLQAGFHSGPLAAVLLMLHEMDPPVARRQAAQDFCLRRLARIIDQDHLVPEWLKTVNQHGRFGCMIVDRDDEAQVQAHDAGSNLIRPEECVTSPRR